MKAEIDLMDNKVYAVCDGQLYEVPAPVEGYGKQLISWNDGKPLLKSKNESVCEFVKVK